jgi:NAD(P)-dependent dehydrogenase (short-subunit alcohol dehydrogenase family)
MAGSVVVVGGSSGIGEDVAKHYAEQGRKVYVSSRTQERADEAATRIGGDTHGIALDLAHPEGIAACMVPAVLRDSNAVKDFNVAGARDLAVLKIVGYPETVHQLMDRFTDESSVLLFGGLAKERPYPGSTTVTSVNGGVEKMVNTLVREVAPIRVNAIHPGFILDSWYWEGNDAVVESVLAKTPTGRPVLQRHIVDAVRFLLENDAMNGVNLVVDGGWLMG